MRVMLRYFRVGSVALACAYFSYYASTYTEWHFIDNVDLIFHEAGHTIFSFLGMFVYAAAGSAFQIALPFGIALYFFLNDQKLSGALCLLWVAANILNVSVYAGDAAVMQLPLLGGDPSTHDWNYLLSATGMLRYTRIIASTIFDFGIVMLLTGTALSLYYAWKPERKYAALM